MTDVTPGSGTGRLAVAPRRRALKALAWLVALGAIVAFAAYEATHPEALPISQTQVTATTPVGVPVYVGAFVTPADFGRTIHVSGVRVFATSTTDVTITPRLCRGGSVGVTTTPDSFCGSLTGTEGVTLHAGDTIVLEVVADQPGSVGIDRVRVAYRDGWRRAVQDAGARAAVTILAR